MLAVAVDPKQSFLELATEAARRSLEAVDHQAFGFGDLVELLGDGRVAGHTPLVDVLFSVQNADDRYEDSAPFVATSVENHTAKFDLSLIVDESRASIDLAIEYRTSLFKAATIERYLRCLDQLIADAVARPTAPVETLSLLTAADRHHVLVELNRTDVAYPPVTAAHHLFEAAATRFPGHRALVHGEVSFSYADVEAAANRLAHQLAARGVGRESIVAILSPPSCELIIAELAVLKAGAAFLPLDHRYPRERLEYMLRDSAAQVLLAAPGHADARSTGPAAAWRSAPSCSPPVPRTGSRSRARLTTSPT